MLSNYAPSTIAWIPSLEAFMMFAGVCANAFRYLYFAYDDQGPVIGKIYDNYGPLYLLMAGTFFHVFGLMMTSLATEYYQFILAQGICSALGASMIFYPGTPNPSSISARLLLRRHRHFSFHPDTRRLNYKTTDVF